MMESSPMVNQLIVSLLQMAFLLISVGLYSVFISSLNIISWGEIHLQIQVHAFMVQDLFNHNCVTYSNQSFWITKFIQMSWFKKENLSALENNVPPRKKNTLFLHILMLFNLYADFPPFEITQELDRIYTTNKQTPQYLIFCIFWKMSSFLNLMTKFTLPWCVKGHEVLVCVLY